MQERRRVEGGGDVSAYTCMRTIGAHTEHTMLMTRQIVNSTCTGNFTYHIK